jgi:hypothetical protein
VEFRDFSQFPRSLVTIDQDFIARVLLAACLIAEDPAKYLNYHYLNDPKYDGQKARLPDGTIRTSQSTPPSDFFNTAAGEKLIIEKSNDGKDIIFIRQKGEEPFSQIFFIFTMQQLNDLLRAESISDPQTLFKTNLLALFQLRIPK